MALDSYSPGVSYTEDEVIPEVVGPDQLCVGIVGGAKKGPTDLTLITTVPQLWSVFGTLSHEDFGVWAAWRAVKNGGKVYYKRVIGAGATYGEAKVDGKALSFETKEFDSTLNDMIVRVALGGGKQGTASVAGTGLKFITKDKNATLNGYTIKVEEADDKYTITVSDGETVKETVEGLVTKAGDENNIFVKFNKTSTLLTVQPAKGEGFVGVCTIRGAENDKYIVSCVQGKKTVERFTGMDLDEGSTHNLVAVINKKSTYINAEQIAGVEVKDDNITGDYKIAGCNDGIATITPDQLVEAIEIFQNTDTLDVSSVIAPGCFDSKVLGALKSLAEARGDIQTIPDCPSGLTKNELIDWANASGDYESDTKMDSMHQGAYWPWVYDEDPHTREVFLTPPSGWVVSQFIYNDKTAGAWFSSAGVQEGRGRGVLVGAKGLEYEMTKEERDEIYVEAQVNPIVRFYNKGIAIWGNRTCYRDTSGSQNSFYTYMNIRRLANYIRKIVISESLKLVFDPNDSLTWRAWKLAISPRLDVIKANRGIEAYKLVMDESTVTEEAISKGEMPGIIYVKPIKAVEYIPISFIITEDSVTFEETTEEGEA